MDDQRSCERRKKNKRCKQINIRKEKEKSTKILRRNKDAKVQYSCVAVTCMGKDE